MIMISVNHVHLLLSAILSVLYLDVVVEPHRQSALVAVSTLASLGAQAVFFKLSPLRSHVGPWGRSIRAPRTGRFLGVVRLLDDVAGGLPNTSTSVAALRALRLYSELGTSAFLSPARDSFRMRWQKAALLLVIIPSMWIAGCSSTHSNVDELGPPARKGTPVRIEELSVVAAVYQRRRSLRLESGMDLFGDARSTRSTDTLRAMT